MSDAALELARQRAAEHGVTLETVRLDLHADGPPAGPWDVVVCLNYLEPAVWPALQLAPGCTVVWIHPPSRISSVTPNRVSGFCFSPAKRQTSCAHDPI